MESQLLKIQEIAQLLKISRALAYRLCLEGAIPSVRFGRTVRCRPQDLEEFVFAHINNKKVIAPENNGGSHE